MLCGWAVRLVSQRPSSLRPGEPRPPSTVSRLQAAQRRCRLCREAWLPIRADSSRSGV